MIAQGIDWDFATSASREKSTNHAFEESIYCFASRGELRSDLIKLSESLVKTTAVIANHERKKKKP